MTNHPYFIRPVISLYFGSGTKRTKYQIIKASTDQSVMTLRSKVKAQRAVDLFNAREEKRP